MSACNSIGIVPNPDISGIGVRAAIYAQAILTLVQPILASLDGHISEKELIGLHRLYLGILLPGCALLVSAIIQAKTQGLSVYHAVLVLNLSWINNTSALIFFQFALITQIKLEKERIFRRHVGEALKLLYQLMGETKTVTRTPDGLVEDPDGIRRALKERAYALKNALAKKPEQGTEKEKFFQSRDILDEVVQNLSALRAAVTDDMESTAESYTGEVGKVMDMRGQRNRLFESLGVDSVEAGDTIGPKPWWNWIGHGLQTMIEWILRRLPQGERVVKLVNRDWIMAGLASAHLTLFAAFGAWVSFTIVQFGDCDSITRETRLAILPHVNIRVTSALRIWFIVLYIICLVPFLNIILIGALEVLVIVIVQRIFPSKKAQEINNDQPPQSQHQEIDRDLPLGGFIFLTLLVQVYFISTTELTIRTNQHLLDDAAQEGNWTFGQTLAVALVAIPLIEVVNQSWEERKEVWLLIKKPVSLVKKLGYHLFNSVKRNRTEDHERMSG